MRENRYRIESVYQAGQVLKTVAESREPMGSIAIARTLDMTSNTSFRVCQTLEELGFLKQVGDRYELGMGLALFWARKKSKLEAEREMIGRDLEKLETEGDEDGGNLDT